MGKIEIIKMTEDQVKEHGINSWPIWEKEASEFPWTYDSTEACYFIEGDVTVVTEDGEEVTISKGDYVEFPKGMSCTWKINQKVKKYYNFS